MCGRTACSLDKDGIQRATCQYSRKEDTSLKWVEKYEWQNYRPSYNLSPTQISPVLVNESVFEKSDDIVITPMRWGFIPSWYKGSLKNFTLTTNNCRYESILEKPTYKRSVSAAFRCVILADGFYEWKVTNNKQKQPYFIYFPQDVSPEIFSQSFSDSPDIKLKEPRLLTMAGLFDVWKSPEKEILYSYSVITLEASKTVSFVHHRMPAILNGKDEISFWLDVNRVPTKEAITHLKPIDDLQMHPVSVLVNNSRNNSVECVKPLKKDKNKSDLKPTGLTTWLKRGTTNESPVKRQKVDIP